MEYCESAESALPNTDWSVSETGWTRQGLATMWFTETFLVNIGSERPQTLVLDGHEPHDSHNFLELLDIANSH